MEADKEIRERLNAVVREIEAIYSLIGKNEPKFPDEASQRLAAGICLECGKKLGKGKSAKRGCHEACFRRQMRAIERGEFTDFEAIERGTLAPPAKGGRKPIPTTIEKEKRNA